MSDHVTNKSKPDADALVNATKCLKYEEPSILNEVVQARNKKEVIDKHLICHMQQHDIAISTSQADE